MGFNKKNDHVELAQVFHEREKQSDFDSIKYLHHSFPQMGVDDVDIKTSMAGLDMEVPFFINAMTGGSDMTKKVNEKLALVARECDLLMASGSLSVAMKDPDLMDSFKIIRKTNPNGKILANLGAEHSVENAKRAMDALEADGLQIHVNSIQELVMPEGDRDFSKWLSSIENLVNNIDKPIIVKEVGFGMSKKTLEELKNIGVKTVDIGGYGGTNFAKIENFRRDKNKYDYLEDFGQSTIISLLEAQDYLDDLEIIGSGGIRNPLDIIKVLSLGSSATGIAGTILDMVLNRGVENSIETINNWKSELKVIMTILGKKNIDELKTAEFILSGRPKEWCQARNIDYRQFANR